MIGLVGGFAAEGIRPWIWLASLIIDFVATRAAERADWHLQPGHFAERYGLLVIVALGETVIAIGVGRGGAAGLVVLIAMIGSEFAAKTLLIQVAVVLVATLVIETVRYRNAYPERYAELRG